MCAPEGMDPKDDHREAAARTLREVVLLRRAQAQSMALQQATAGASPGAGGSARPASAVSDLPEFLMVFAIYVLAHHPDCPQVRTHNS